MPRKSIGRVVLAGDHFKTRIRYPDGTRPWLHFPHGMTEDSASKMAIEIQELATAGKITDATDDDSSMVKDGSVEIRQIYLPSPSHYSEYNQTWIPRKDWLFYLKFMGVKFFTPKSGINVVLASDLDEAHKRLGRIGGNDPAD